MYKCEELSFLYTSNLHVAEENTTEDMHKKQKLQNINMRKVCCVNNFVVLGIFT